MKKESTYKTQDNDKIGSLGKTFPYEQGRKDSKSFRYAFEATIPPEQVKKEVTVFLDISELTLMESMQGLIEVFWAWRIPVISLMEHKAVTKAMRPVSEKLLLPFVEEFVQKLSLLF